MANQPGDTGDDDALRSASESFSLMSFSADGARMSQEIFHTAAGRKAWDKLLESLTEEQKEAFMKCGTSTVDDYMKHVDEAARRHKEGSRTRKINAFIEPFRRAVGPVFSAAASSASQAYPPSCIVTGGVIYLLKISEDFTAYQEELSSWLSKLSFKARLLVDYDLCIYQHDERVQDVLVLVYGDILQFFKEALKIFENPKATGRANGFRMLGRSMKDDFKQTFGPIIESFEMHMEEYKEATLNCDKQWVMKFYASHARQVEQQKESRQEQRQAHQELLGASNEYRDQNKVFQSSTSEKLNKMLGGQDQQQNEIARLHAEEEKYRREQKRLTVLAWIDSVDFTTEQDRRMDLKTEDTAVWLQDHSVFRDWMNATSNAILLVKGKPGCGKSILAAETWNLLWSLRDNMTGVAHFYCQRGHPKRADPDVILLSMYKELCHQKKNLTPELESLYDSKVKIQTNGPGSTDLTSLLPLMLSQFHKSFLLVDGLDECNDPKKVLTFLRKSIQKMESRVKLIVFSRSEYADIESFFKGQGSFQLFADTGANSEDLKAFVDQKFNANDLEWEDNQEVLSEVKAQLIEKAEGVFLYATLQAKTLRPEFTKSQLLKRLKSLPKDLNATYNDAMDRIMHYEHDESRDVALTILTWVANCFRPLSEEELAEALAIYPGMKSLGEIDRRSSSRFGPLCADLIEIDGDGFYNVIHSSVQDYLTGLEKKPPGWFPDYAEKQVEAHKTIGIICLTYLLLEEFQVGPLDSLPKLQEFMQTKPFLEYAATFWADHVQKTQQDSLSELVWMFITNNPARNLVMQILLQKFKHINVFPYKGGQSALHILCFFGLSELAAIYSPPRTLFLERDEFRCIPLDYALLRNHRSICLWILQNSDPLIAQQMLGKCSYSPLYAAILNEWNDILDELIEKRMDVNRRIGRIGAAPLAEAARRGYVKGVSKLLDAGANANIQDMKGDTPLILASCNEHFDIAHKLLLSGADPNIMSGKRMTPLHWAVYRGNTFLVNLFIGNGACVNQKGLTGFNATPLHFAAHSNHTDIVKILLNSGANLEAEDMGGFRPLHTTTVESAIDAARSLRAFGADETAKSYSGYFLLMLAARFSNEEFVKFVLESNPLIEERDANGFTALHWAVSITNISACRLLLEYGAMPEAKDNYGRTAFHIAAANGSVEIVRELVKLGNDLVHPEALDFKGRTAIYYAAGNGHPKVLKELLNVFGSESLATEPSGITPLHTAAYEGHWDVVQLLLREGKLPGVDSELNLPIHCAAKQGHEQILELLLKHYDLNTPGFEGRTALWNAVAEGHVEVVEMLLKKGAQTDIHDNDGDGPLKMALSTQRTSIAEALIAHGASLSATNKQGSSIMHAAAGIGHKKILKKMLKSGYDHTIRDDEGATPFLDGVMSGDVGVIKTFMDANVTGSTDVDNYGRTAMHIAALCGHFEIFDLLQSLKCNERALDALDADPLIYAASRGHVNIVRRLLELGAPVNGPIGSYFGSPLLVAAGAGAKNVIDLLLQHGAAINATGGPYGDTALTRAASLAKPQTLRILLAAGADPSCRNSFGMDACDYAHKRSPIFESMVDMIESHRFESTPTKASEQVYISQNTIKHTLKSLLKDEETKSLGEPSHRLGEIYLLATILLHSQDYSEHESAKLLLLERWHNQTNNGLSTGFECDGCRTSLVETDVYICTECVELDLCPDCYSCFSRAQIEGKKLPDDFQALENLEVALKTVSKHVSLILREGTLMELFNTLNSLSAWSEWLEAQSKVYEKFKRQNGNGFLSSQGKQLLKLLERANSLCETTTTGDDIERLSRITDLERGFREFDCNNDFELENRQVWCCGHEFIKLGQEEFDRAKAEGFLDDNGRVCESQLNALLEKYKDIPPYTSDEIGPTRTLTEEACTVVNTSTCGVGLEEPRGTALESSHLSRKELSPEGLSRKTAVQIAIDLDLDIPPYWLEYHSR